MTPTTAPIAESNRIALGDVLDQAQSNLRTLYDNAKQAHWNVQGPTFAGLHLLFEEVATVASSERDKLAEVARYLGAQPNAHRAATIGTIPVYPSGDTCEKYTRALLGSVSAMIDSLRVSGEPILVLDPVTQNTIISTIEALRVVAYKLQSHLP